MRKQLLIENSFLQVNICENVDVTSKFLNTVNTADEVDHTFQIFGCLSTLFKKFEKIIQGVFYTKFSIAFLLSL